MDGSFASGLKNWLGTKNVAYARTMLIGLANACPLGDVDEHCPLREIRSLPPEKRVAWLNACSDSEIDDFFSRHFSCLKKRG